MRQLGWTECDVIELDLDGLEATALGIALNRTGELAEWDGETLAKLLDELRVEGALDGVGFDDAEIDELLAGLEDEVGEIDDQGAGELGATAISKTGDLWVLGGHRLLCGDSTSAPVVDRLMDGQKAHLLATDPPYLVDYRGAPLKAGDIQEADEADGHWDDYKGDDDGLAFFTAFLRLSLAHCVDRVPVYQWHAHRRQALVERAWHEVGLLMHQQIIWTKGRGTLGRSHFMWSHEPCFYGWPEGMMPAKGRRPELSSTTTWDIDQGGEESEAHPTQKPLEIFERPIAAHTLPGEIVLEPFSGSGSQIIAAEKLGRRCFAMEMDALYVDLAVRRWQKATGQSAVLDGSGETFDEVTAARTSQPSPEPAEVTP
jgi:DNA modification methylase